MTLRKLLERHGIHTIRELTRRTGLTRQQGWNLWHGYTGIGRKLLPILHKGTGIPYDELLQVEPIPHSQRPRRGRPDKQRRQEPREQSEQEGSGL
jgi:transcriptional regulator with XRE-family HTH domain